MNIYQLYLAIVETEADETVTHLKNENFAVTQYENENLTTTANIINDEQQTLAISYWKDLSRIITIINDQWTDFEKSLREVKADAASNMR